MPNQHKSLPPEAEIRECAEWYWKLGISEKEIVVLLEKHYDTHEYGLSQRSFRRLREKWGLKGTRQQQHTLESVAHSISHIRERFPTMGARQMVVELRQNYGLRVPEKIVATYLKITEPEAVAARKGRRFVRRLFWCAGVNDLWAFDQHDKWKRFGLYLHLGIDPYPGEILWLKIWWTNRNPRLVTSYYLEAARRKGGICLVTQSDPGTENYGIANCHTNIRHHLDETLTGTLQHRWMRHKSNIKPEIVWSLLRRSWSPGFEDILNRGVFDGLYDPSDNLQRLVFLWLAIPWLQSELDTFSQRFNKSPRRADRHKLTPQGIPSVISMHPDRYNARDYKIVVPPELFDEMEAQWAPSDHDVFHLTPQEFHRAAQAVYVGLNEPSVSSSSFWHVYAMLLDGICNLPEDLDLQDAQQSQQRVAQSIAHAETNPDVPLLSGLQELPLERIAMGNYHLDYAGGLSEAPASILPSAFPDLDDEDSVDEQEDERVFAPLTPSPPGSPT